MSAYEKLTSALESRGCRRSGSDWTCPHHKDGAEKRPSLSVNQGSKGVVMTCGAGCDNVDVLKTLGMKVADLFDAPLPDAGKEKKHIAATYDYTDEHGQLLYQVVRWEPKGFSQRVPNGKGGWTWSIKDVRKVPFHLEQLVHAAVSGERVFVVEGEKDVLAIEAAGGVATCNSGGAGKWLDEFAQYLRGAKVVVVADKDEAGTKHANLVASSLAPCEFVQAKIGKDAADHLGAGYTLDEFLPWIPASDVAPERVNPIEARLLSIDEILNIPPPTYIIEDFIVSDAIAVLYGLPGSAKSFVALDWAFCVAHGLNDWHGKKVLEGPVLYVVAEGLSGVGIRMTAWRKHNPVFNQGDLTWLRDPVNLLDAEAVNDLVEVCDRLQPILIVVDTLARSMPGADENAPAPMSSAIEALDLLRRKTRAGVLALHHSPKDGGTPRGHSSLLGAVQTSIKSTMVDGLVTLTVEKQKDGETIEMELRLTKAEQSAVLESNADDHRRNDGSLWSEMLIEKALRENALVDGLSNADLMELTGLAKPTYFRARKALNERGRIIAIGRQRWALRLGAD